MKKAEYFLIKKYPVIKNYLSMHHGFLTMPQQKPRIQRKDMLYTSTNGLARGFALLLLWSHASLGKTLNVNFSVPVVTDGLYKFSETHYKKSKKNNHLESYIFSVHTFLTLQ
uniref:Uncharacterized protein n=1 Tax=Ciona intestinalis TaxID=7719 RepID=H2XMN1_CIOIN